MSSARNINNNARHYNNNSSPSNDVLVETDQQALAQASTIQQDTKAALQRAQQQASETIDIGVTTLEELNAQRAKLDEIQQQNDRLDAALTQSEKLQNRLGKWAFSWRSHKVAKRKAEQERQQQQELDRKKQDRAMQRQAELQHATKKEEVSVSVPYRKTPKNSRKTQSSSQKTTTRKIGLMEGIDLKSKNHNEYQKDFEKLALADAEIDQSLDVLGSQLDSLLTLSQEVTSATQNQSQGMTDISTRLEETKHRQNMVNKRTTRFFTGQKRHEHEKQDTLNPAALVRMAQKSLDG